MRNYLRVFLLTSILSVYATVVHSQANEHFIIYGQSLSTGHQSWPPISTENVEGNYMIGAQMWSNMGNSRLTVLRPLVSKVALSDASFPKTRAMNTCAENPLVGAVNHIRLKTMDPAVQYIASSVGVGGKTIEELSKEFYDPWMYNDFLKLLGYGAAFDPICPAVVFMQGEYNYIVPWGNSGLTSSSRPTADKNEYKSLFVNMKSNMQVDIMRVYNQTRKPLFITYQAGMGYTRGKTLEIGMAQLEASNEHDDIVCAGPVYPMTNRVGHLDSNGYRWYGEMIGKAYYQTEMLNKPFAPLQPIEFYRTDDPKTVEIKFNVVHLPLVLDDLILIKQTDWGFELYKNNKKVVLSNIAVSGDVISITSNENLTGDVEVVYAGETNNGCGNLRDSDPYQAFYAYEDLDKTNMDGSFFYDRDASETTLRPNYEPRDVDGIMYGKPYPLYNFSVAFYYKLNANQDKITIPVKTTTGSDKNNTQKALSVTYVDNGLTVNLPSMEMIKKLDLFNLSGMMIASVENFNSGEVISLALSKGIYLAQISSLEQTQSVKIIVK